MKAIKQLTFFSVIAFFISCSQNKEEIILTLNQKVGDEQTIVSEIETKGNEQMSMKSTVIARFKVSAKDAKNVYTYTTNVLNIKSETKMFGEIEEYDSNKNESLMTSDEKSMHYEFKNALDSTFEILIDEKGNIVKPFYNTDGSGTSDAIVDISNIQLVFPKDKVTINSKWEDEKTNPLTKTKTKSTYTIKDITEDKIIISVNAVIDGVPGLLEQNNVAGEYILNKKDCTLLKGTLEMNLQTGGKVTNTYYKK